MAGIALDHLVPPLKGKFRILAMIEDKLFPLVAAMTLLALGVITAIVHIVDQVAAITFLGRILIVLVGMAEFAIDLAMLADELPLGIFVVIESHRIPFFFIVTVFTFFTVAAAVKIVGLVA